MVKILLLAGMLYMQPKLSHATTNPECSAVFDTKTNGVMVRWKHSVSEAGTYLIQRSSDNQSWANIALQGVPLDLQDKSFSFEDKKPAAGKNYYRLKFIAVNDEVTYSAGVMVIIPAANNWVMYPVPVTNMLTLDYRGTEPIKGVINIYIQRNTGTIITRLRSSSLNKTFNIPVGNLGKGIYDIRIIVVGEIVWNQRFVK